MKLTRLQLFNLLHEMNYDNSDDTITSYFKRVHKIEFFIAMDNSCVLNFNSTHEELLFKLKYSDAIHISTLT